MPQADDPRGPRVVLADDSVLLREGVGRLLEDAGFEVVGQAGDADELLRKVAEHEPDVAIVDIRMPPTTPTKGCAPRSEIRERYPGVGVLVLSQYVETAYASTDRGRRRRRRLPAQGPRRGRRAFADAVRRVAEGGSALDPEIVSAARRRARRRDDPLDDADRPRARGARADGRGPVEPCDRGAARGDRARGREARTSIFAKLRLTAERTRPPPRAGRAHVPAGLRRPGFEPRFGLRRQGGSFLECAAECRHPVGEPYEPRPPRRVDTADAVVDDLDVQS